MTRFSVTGIRNANHDEHRRIIGDAIALLNLTKNDYFATGGQFGVDTIAAIEAYEQFEDAHHGIFYPADQKWNWQLENSIPAEYIGVMGSYMNRNKLLALFCDTLLAFPNTEEEERRSGTWATIRMVHKLRKPILVYPLDGSQTFSINLKEG